LVTNHTILVQSHWQLDWP